MADVNPRINHKQTRICAIENRFSSIERAPDSKARWPRPFTVFRGGEAQARRRHVLVQLRQDSLLSSDKESLPWRDTLQQSGKRRSTHQETKPCAID